MVKLADEGASMAPINAGYNDQNYERAGDDPEQSTAERDSEQDSDGCKEYHAADRPQMVLYGLRHK